MKARRADAWRALVGSALVASIVVVATATVARAALVAWPQDAPWTRDAACGRDLGRPAPATRDGCAAAHCIEHDGAEVCACRLRDDAAAPSASDDTAASPDPAASAAPDPDAAPEADVASGRDAAPADPLQAVVRFTVRRDGAQQSWPRDTMLGDTAAFRVAHADLDGDGRDELVVGALESVSNGMAVQTWSLCVLDGRDLTSAPVCTTVDDYPFLGMLTRAPGARGCRLLEARWRWGAEPERGDGLYLVGRWLAYANGALAPDATRPTIARRYLYRFAAQRAAAIESASTAPILWFRDATTRVVRCPDPLCDGGDATTDAAGVNQK